jgi:hypothetical protein
LQNEGGEFGWQIRSAIMARVTVKVNRVRASLEEAIAEVAFAHRRQRRYLRDFRIYAPPDCTASESNERNREVLMLMQHVLKADISLSTDLKLEQLA